MTTPIYHLFIVHGFREAYYQLSTEESNRMWARSKASSEAAGSEFIAGCNSRWCDEQIAGWGVEKFPDLASRQKCASTNEANLQYRYIDAESYLGTKVERLPS